jgi:hypothetical protein
LRVSLRLLDGETGEDQKKGGEGKSCRKGNGKTCAPDRRENFSPSCLSQAFTILRYFGTKNGRKKMDERHAGYRAMY